MSAGETAVTLYSVILEWDGTAPPSKWYRTLFRLTGVKKRGKVKELAAKESGKSLADLQLLDELRALPSAHGALVDDATDDDGTALYVQEGAIVTASRSLAFSIAQILREGFICKGEIVRPKAIMVSRNEVLDFDGDPDTEKAVRRIKALFSRRGRKGPAVHYVVTCLEELKTREVITSKGVANCQCGATHIRRRHGELTPVGDPGGDLFEAWVQTRFVVGNWEVPNIKTDAPVAVAVDFKDERERAFVKLLESSPARQVVTDLADGAISRGDAFSLLDAVFSSRLYTDDDTRSLARTPKIVEYFQGGGSFTDITIAEMPNSADIFDASSTHIGATVPSLYAVWVASQMDNE